MVFISFFRIEEEELDKFNIPVKVESEKYKVIRTFSFLKNRMSSTRNKSKVNQDTSIHQRNLPLQFLVLNFRTALCFKASMPGLSSDIGYVFLPSL